MIMTSPIHLGNGRYQISIEEIQRAEDGPSSRKILTPFLEEGNFKELVIFCVHVPRWLQKALEDDLYVAQIEELGEEKTKLTLTPKEVKL
jgi:hypothetical protein